MYCLHRLHSFGLAMPAPPLPPPPLSHFVVVIVVGGGGRGGWGQQCRMNGGPDNAWRSSTSSTPLHRRSRAGRRPRRGPCRARRQAQAEVAAATGCHPTRSSARPRPALVRAQQQQQRWQWSQAWSFCRRRCRNPQAASDAARRTSAGFSPPIADTRKGEQSRAIHPRREHKE